MFVSILPIFQLIFLVVAIILGFVAANPAALPGGYKIPDDDITYKFNGDAAPQYRPQYQYQY